MSGGHAHALYVHGDSPIHRLPPECKLLAQVGFVFAVVATPREAFWAFGVYAIMVAIVAQFAGLTMGFVAKRLVIEVPFVVFAVFLPLIGQGERIDVLGLSLSVEGLWAMWNILIKGTIGVAASVILASTTSVAGFLRGLDRLHLPRAFTSITGFMVRYSEVITSEAHRMKVARESRGYDARWLWQAKGFAASAGALFIRSFERGERVHLAMLSRGYDGTMPETDDDRATRRQWVTSLAVPVFAALIAMTAWVIRP
ncbi:MAG TPA: cobalt ECF transporter T component CbiQ [Actinomycetota bacterium]